MVNFLIETIAQNHISLCSYQTNRSKETLRLAKQFQRQNMNYFGLKKRRIDK